MRSKGLTDIVMLEVLDRKNRRNTCKLFHTPIAIWDAILKKVRTAWLRRARRAEYVKTLADYVHPLVPVTIVDPDESAVDENGNTITIERKHMSVLNYIKELVLNSTYDTTCAADAPSLAAILPDSRTALVTDIRKLLRLRRRLVPTVGTHATLDGVLCGHYVHFPAKFAVPFFGALGHSFTINYKPQKIPMDAKWLMWCIRNGVVHVERMAHWISKHWLLVSHHLHLANRHLYNDEATATPTLFETLRCFRRGPGHVTVQELHHQGTLGPELAVCENWATRMKRYVQEVQDAVEVVDVVREAAAKRLTIFDTVFKHVLPRGDIWAGSFEFDGQEICFRSINVMQGHISDTWLAKLDLPHDVEECRVDTVFLALLQHASTFGKVEEVKRCKHMGQGYRRNLRNPQPQKAGQPADGHSYRIFSTLEWLSGGKSRWQFDEAGDPNARYRGARPFVRLNKPPAQERTKKGLPVGLDILSASSAIDIGDSMRQLVDGRDADAEDDDKEYLRRLRIAGNDLGLVVPSAIAINSPVCAAQQPEAQGVQLQNNTSITMILRATDLQEQIRRRTSFKHYLRNNHYIRIDTIRKDPSLEFAQNLWKMHALHEQLVQSSPAYEMNSHLHRRQRRSIEDRIFHQFCKVAFPRGEKSLPLLFVVGDSCGLTSKGAARKTADFANPIFVMLRKKCLDNKMPIRFVLVNEAFSSQVCPNPSCFNERIPPQPPKSDKRKNNDKCTQHAPRRTPAGACLRGRSRLFKAFWSGTIDPCQRVLQCETCNKAYHRDASAAMNIAFIAWHILRFGRHPWFEEHTVQT
ncbi:hypothetical protein EMMF5_005498 [Cystobasidiomycetes sp. EMM_F5]